MDAALQTQFARVQALRDSELKSRPLAQTRNDIPVAYELITKDWLNDVLCRDTPNAEVREFSLDAPDEGTSNRRRIFLTYNMEGDRAGLPDAVFCKATQSIESRYMLGMIGASDGEPYFHNQIRPELDIEAPRAYFAGADPESLNSIIVMADLGKTATFCDETTPITLDNAKSQMRLLATLHSRFHVGTAQHELIKSYPCYEDWCRRVESAVGWSTACAAGFQAARDVIPARLFAHAPAIWPATERAWEMHKSLPRTFIHGDVHLKNWYIAQNGEMGLSDWQTGAQGHWSRDLAYAISTALTVDNRRAWEDELIDYYLAQLSARGVTGVDKTTTMALYRQQLFPSLAMWTGTLTPNPGAPDMQPKATSIEFIKRITHAIDDHNALAVAAYA